MTKEELRKMLAELHKEFWEEELKIHGYYRNELSFGAEAFLRWLSKKS